MPSTPFAVVAPWPPAGDQPKAISELTGALSEGQRFVTLHGVTGSGKSATAAWVIENLKRPTLVITPNKSLAAQLSAELRDLLPHNRVEFFVSYYDYYQPEAYLPTSDTFIEKDSAINDEIDRLRHAATSALLTRGDVVVVASVSCIYGLGSPDEYKKQVCMLTKNDVRSLTDVATHLVEIGYDRNDAVLERGRFRVRGDTVEIWPAFEERVLRVEFFGDVIERLTYVEALNRTTIAHVDHTIVFPATHHVASKEALEAAIKSIKDELVERVAELTKEGKALEAQRLQQRTEYDIESLQELGTCRGVENYSRHFDGRAPGSPPSTLLDYFPDDFLVILDESHVTVPQIGGQWAGDRSRKDTLVEHGFRLPSARDNRPLTGEEFFERVPQCIFVSATPGPRELDWSTTVVEQVVRPTGLIDPSIEVVQTTGQVDRLLDEIRAATENNERVLVTTLTKKMSEELTEYLLEHGVRARYLHSDIDTPARIQLLHDLRAGEYDVLVGINLLREGLDLPEVALVVIFDADKEGFLRSASSLIQTIGRAARNVNGRVIMFADKTTDSMAKALGETTRRREAQVRYNADHGITPKSIQKNLAASVIDDQQASPETANKGRGRRKGHNQGAQEELGSTLRDLSLDQLEDMMLEAAAQQAYETAAQLRDELARRKVRVLDKEKKYV